jgi:broad specificity phosphatase PhoE
MSLLLPAANLSVPVPLDRPVALLLRHAERPALPEKAPGDEVPITEAGRQRSRTLGAELAAHLRGLSTSPIRRCVETAEALLHGAGASLEIRRDRMLGDPGAFVVDARLAWETWLQVGTEAVFQALLHGEHVLPGFAVPARAARQLAHHVVQALVGREPGLHLFVSHDVVIGPLVARLLRLVPGDAAMPAFLGGAALWAEGERLVLAYRGMVAEVT